ncbi:MAG: hypothetical protein IPN69_03110 [Acidobacteria bacterium]|nr:hypothetical protein [Acidobacteriota bacterium]
MSKWILTVIALILAASGALFIYVWWSERSETVEVQKTAGGQNVMVNGQPEFAPSPDTYKFAVHKGIWGDPAIFIPRGTYVRVTSDKPFTMKLGDRDRMEGVMLNNTGFTTRHMVVTPDWDEKYSTLYNDDASSVVSFEPFMKNRVVTDSQLPLLVKSELDANILVETWKIPLILKRK